MWFHAQPRRVKESLGVSYNSTLTETPTYQFDNRATCPFANMILLRNRQWPRMSRLALPPIAACRAQPWRLSVAGARLQSSPPPGGQHAKPTPSAVRQSVRPPGINKLLLQANTIQLSGYNDLRKPWLRVFLGAFFTYQILFWCWEKMRIDEIMQQKNAEVEGLEEELRVYQKTKGGQLAPP